MSSPISMRSWPTIPMPFPSEQRSPIVMTGSPRMPICDGMPALMLASGPIVVPAPISIRSSPQTTGRGDATGRLDREIELVDKQARGLPSGSEHDIVRAFGELVDDGAVAIIGPSISDNALIAAPLCDEARIPAINYSGGERTRSQWMFHYQVGSLEEEPPLLATRMAERDLARAAVVFDQSPVGRRYAECF